MRDIGNGAVALSIDELQEIGGGETLAYWIGYAAGVVVYEALHPEMREGCWSAWHS